jgi:hypothetical protein
MDPNRRERGRGPAAGPASRAWALALAAALAGLVPSAPRAAEEPEPAARPPEVPVQPTPAVPPPEAPGPRFEPFTDVVLGAGVALCASSPPALAGVAPGLDVEGGAVFHLWRHFAVEASVAVELSGVQTTLQNVPGVLQAGGDLVRVVLLAGGRWEPLRGPVEPWLGAGLALGSIAYRPKYIQGDAGSDTLLLAPWIAGGAFVPLTPRLGAGLLVRWMPDRASFGAYTDGTVQVGTVVVAVELRWRFGGSDRL